MKKYLLVLSITLGGCSLLEGTGLLSKEYTIPDIAGKAVPASLAGKTLLGSYTDVRFTNGYVAFKSDNAYDTYAAKILELGATTDPYRMFITDGSKDGGHLKFTAFYVTNAGNNIYGFVAMNVDNTNGFPPFYDFTILGPQDNTMDSPEWAVDEAHKPAPLDAQWRGDYTNIFVPPDGSQQYYKITATGVKEGIRGGSSYEYDAGRILRWFVNSSGDLEIYSGNYAFSITPGGAMKTAHYQADQSPGGNVTFPGIADYQKQP